MHLFFIVRYGNFGTTSKIDITELINANPGTSVESWRKFYTENGYTIVEEIYEGGVNPGTLGTGCLLSVMAFLFVGVIALALAVI